MLNLGSEPSRKRMFQLFLVINCTGGEHVHRVILALFGIGYIGSYVMDMHLYVDGGIFHLLSNV